MIIWGLWVGIVSARLVYALRYLTVYIANPLSLLALNGNTLAVPEGLLVGIVFAAIYGWRKKLPLRPTLDALTPGLAVFMIGLGVAHFLSGDAFGAPANVPWSIYLWNEYRHPSQIYETIAALVILGVVMRRPLAWMGAGSNFLLVMALSAAARTFLEAFRGDSVIWPGGFRGAQVIGLMVLMISLYLLRTSTRTAVQSTTKPDQLLETNPPSNRGKVRSVHKTRKRRQI